MDAGLNTSFKGYQAVGTIPLFWLRENLKNGVNQGENRGIFSAQTFKQLAAVHPFSGAFVSRR